MSNTLGILNPLRYRGYVYDTETGLYYLQSRYYNPELGRFINADDIRILSMTNNIMLGLNVFSYVFNNPINQKDSSGYIAHALIGAVAGVIFAALSYQLECVLDMRNHNLGALAGILATAAVVGAVGGYISGWLKFAKLAKYARLPGILKKLKSPLVRTMVTYATKGIQFIINSYVKKLSRKPGESWLKAARRWLSI